ncbi:MAG: fibronectin type III domain-containing protein [Bacteroidales bacterium]|nr:fibronectin type III domain-containing protein [Bacteroidales bacterium]
MFLSFSINADEVNIKDARKLAKNFYYQKSDISFEEIYFSNEYTISEGSIPVYYVFNLSNKNGFVIVSAEDQVLPVLGYSFEGDYFEENQPPQFISWMRSYKDQILFVRENNLEATEKIKSQWSKYSKISEKGNSFFDNRTVVGPLLGDIKWGQGCIYNDTCPADASGPCGHVYAGCVATATGMIMKYHSHPNTGTGSHSYNHATYGTLSANYGATTYDWANMPFSGSNESTAQLLYQIGVSVDMNYGPTGSAAYTGSAVTALINYFSYNPAANYQLRANFPTTWDNMLITELNNDRPLLYRGDGSGGHAFVCDGYDDNYQGAGSLYFHFNWGWNSVHNGYFQLTSLTPGTTHNYTNNQAAGFGIQPITTNVPNSDFTSDGPCPCVGNTVNFYDQSTDGPNGWTWAYSGGTPTSSTNENPSITYNTTGSYNVTLTASNVSGAGNTETKTDYITVYNAPTAATCMPSTSNPGNYWYGILNVTLNNLDHSTGDAYSDGGCMNFTCHHSTTLTPGSTYTMEITVRVGTSGNAHTYAYIDFNNDGDFTDAGECLINNEISTGTSTFVTPIVMPSNPTGNQLLRMRVMTDWTTISSPCSNPAIGQSEDYGVYFSSAPPAPVATAATSVTQTSFDANWNASSGANGYYLDVATDNGFTNFVSGFNNLDVGNVITYNVPGLSANTDYYYRLRAYNANGTSGNSNTISLTTLSNAPAAPNATAATSIAQTVFDANWDASTGATGYYLDVATDNGFTNFVSGYNNLDVGNVVTYNVINLSAATDYYYRVRAYNTGGTSGNSNVISVTTLPNPPAAPNATAATSVTQTDFDANWDSSTGATGYYLDVATDNGFTNFVSGFNNLDVGTDTTHNVSGLSAATDYYYRVRAYNSGGTSGNSNIISVTTLPYAPSAPNATAATNISQTDFDANWDASTGAGGYYLDVATDNGFTNFVSGYNNLDVGNVTTYNVTGLSAATDYYYRVRAYNAGGTSGNSNVINVSTLPYPPAPPNATVATNITQTSFDANWDASTGADGYYLDVATDNGFTNFVSGYNNLNVGNVTTYNVSGLNSNTNYSYRIRAYNTGGTSGNSNVISLTTLKDAPAPPVANAATNISQTAFDANWSPSTDADGYYLDVATDNGFTNFVSGYNNLQVSDTTYFVSGLSPETEYFYRVRAYNNGGTSGNSNVISATTLPNNPGAPVANAATNITQTGFDANWDPASGATSYWLDVATDNGFTNFVSGYENLNVGNVTTYPVTGLNPDTDYFYRLRAENASGTSGNSNVISLTTLPDIPLPPNALPAGIITHTTFNANWDPSVSADYYYLDVATDNGFTSFVSGFENLNVGNVTTYYVIGLSQGTEYFYRLRAENSAGTSGNSNVISVITLLDIPLPPNAYAAGNITQTTFDANWYHSTNADGYYLDVAKDDLFTAYVYGYENLDVGNVTMFNVIGLNPDTEYFYRLRAYNASGTSGNSNVINLTTLMTDIGEFGNVRINIYTSKEFICIRIDDMKEIKGEVTIYNLLGSPLLYKHLKNTKINQIYLNAPCGVYIVKLLLDKKIYTKKLFVSGN